MSWTRQHTIEARLTLRIHLREWPPEGPMLTMTDALRRRTRSYAKLSAIPVEVARST